MSEAQERLDTRTSEDRLQVALHNQRYDFVLKHLNRLESVLEVGTGEGNLSVLLAPKCGRFVGIEFDPAACRVASERLGGGYQVLQADARALPFESESFSGIVCLEVLEHLGDFVAGVKNIHRCLRNDGMAILSIPWRGRGGPSATNKYHVYEPGEGELLDVLGSHFAQIRVFYQYFEETLLMTMGRVLRLRRLLGLQALYQALTEGAPEALARLKIQAPPAHGLKLHLVVIVEAPRASILPNKH